MPIIDSRSTLEITTGKPNLYQDSPNLSTFKPAIQNPYNVDIKTDISKDYRGKGGPVRQTVGITNTPNPLIDRNRITKADIFPKTPKSVTFGEGWRDDFGRSYGNEGRWRPGGGRPGGGRPGGGMGGPGGGGGVQTQTMPATNPIVQSLNNSLNNPATTNANYGLQTPSGTIQNIKDTQTITKPKSSPIFEPQSSPISSPSSPRGAGLGVAGAGKALTQSQIARGAGLISGLAIAQAAVTGGMIGWGIADLINKLDPAGKEFLDDYFGKEVDKPVIEDKPIRAEIDLPVPPPQPIPSPSPIPVPSPIPPAPAPTSIPNAEWLLLEITYSGRQDATSPWYYYGPARLRFDDNSYKPSTLSLDGVQKIWVLSNKTNIEPRRYTVIDSGDYDSGSGLKWFSETIINYIYILGIGDFVEGFNFPRNRTIYQNPRQYNLGGVTSGTGYTFDWIYTPNLTPPPQFLRTPTMPYPYVELGGYLLTSIRVLNQPEQPWTPPDTWKPPEREDDMGCDLSPVMQQLQQQKSQITTLQNTVNNISLNTSNVQNINANTTTVVNNAISSINSNTSSVVTNATNAINSNTSSVVNTATNAINSSTASTVNNAASAINSNIANLSSKLSQVGDDILLGIKNGFATLEAWLRPALNTIENLVKNLVDEFAKFFEKFTKFLKWIQFDRVLNLLILVTTIHNAAMLSNQLLSSLTSMVNSLLTAGSNALGLRSVDDEPIDIGPAVSGAFNSFIEGFVGKENNAELKKQWNKYNRIYQAAANLLNSIQSLNSTIIGALEIVGGNVARIGNALKKAGEINEKAFNWMNPQPFFNNPFSQMVEKAEQGISNTDQVAQEVISAQEQVEQIKKDTSELHKLITEEEKTSPALEPPVKTTETETKSKEASTISPAPLLPSEK